MVGRVHFDWNAAAKGKEIRTWGNRFMSTSGSSFGATEE
jgi:hypothetical protein